MHLPGIKVPHFFFLPFINTLYMLRSSALTSAASVSIYMHKNMSLLLKESNCKMQIHKCLHDFCMLK